MHRVSYEASVPVIHYVCSNAVNEDFVVLKCTEADCELYSGGIGH